MDSDSPTILATQGSGADTESGLGAQTPRRGDPLRLERGSPVGRYVILDQVGSGGMGTVYGAYDPELDRKVAVKLMHLSTGGETHGGRRRSRLLREAQAMARLSHPNVVAVYDVGSVGGDVFIAMEFVDGPTLSGWTERKRPWEEVLGVFVQAGRGLAAAHAKDLVHRDFKPDNVLIAEDGRARVTDFGLARAMSDAGDASATEGGSEGGIEKSIRDSSDAPATEGDLLASPLTMTGALMGTPAYMSPEQFMGERADARSDQFSFCVALWEALYGRTPFAGDSAAARSLAVTQGGIQDTPRETEVPVRIRRALERGLAVKAVDRFANMDGLLDALRGPPRRRWRKLAIGAGLGGAVVALGLGLATGPAQSTVCRAGAEKLAGVWDDTERERVGSRFGEAGRDYATSTLATVRTALDAYAERWVTGYTDACEDTHLRGEQSSEMLDLRMACLESRRVELEEFVDRLGSADEQRMRAAARAVEKLGNLSVCADRDRLRMPTRLPDDPDTRRAIAETEAKLARLRAATNLGQYQEGLEMARAAEQEARLAGHGPLIAEAIFELGVAQWLNDDPKTSVKTIEAGFHEAIAAHHDALAINAATELVHMYGGDLEQTERALGWASHARGLLHRLGRDPEANGRLANALGVVYEEKGEFDEAMRLYQAAVDAREADHGRRDIGVANALNNIALILEIQTRHEEALEKHREALAIRTELGGESHPDVGDSHNNLGLVLAGIGRYDEARVAFEKAIEIYDAALGPKSLSSASALNNLGSLMSRFDDHERALELYALSLEIRERELGADNAQVASILKNRGDTLVKLERFDEAREVLERALAIQQKQLGLEHAYTSETIMYLGNIDRYEEKYAEAALRYRESLRILGAAFPKGHGMTAQARLYLARAVRDGGDPKAALPLFEAALAMADEVMGATHSLTGNVAHDLGAIHLDARRPAKALPLLELALKIRQTEYTPATALGETLFAVARALPAKPNDGRARKLAQEAKVAFAKDKRADQVAEVDAWLR